jgi:hypothetical protein
MDAHRSDEHSVCVTQFFLAAYAIELIEASTITNVIFLSDFFIIYSLYFCIENRHFIYILLLLECK